MIGAASCSCVRGQRKRLWPLAWIPGVLIEQPCVCKMAETKVPRLFSHSHRPSPQTHCVNDLQPPACLITVWLAQDDLPPLSAPSLSPQSAPDFQITMGAECFRWIQQRPAERRADIFIRWWGEYGFFFSLPPPPGFLLQHTPTYWIKSSV